jgi:hypothetical protein
MAEAGGRIERGVHWLLGRDGSPIVTAEVAVAALDLESRRLVEPVEADAEVRRAEIIPGLRV